MAQTTRSIAPPPYLCHLVEEITRNSTAVVPLEQLDRALRNDDLNSEDREILSLAAPSLARALPDHPQLAVVQGLRRRSKVRAATAEILTRSIEAGFSRRGHRTMVAGDLGMARTYYSNHGDRPIVTSTVIVPQNLHRSIRMQVVKEASQATAGEILAGQACGIEKLGVRATVQASLSAEFDLSAARAWLWQSACRDAVGNLVPAPEVLVLESIYQSALGAPTIRWYRDAVFALDRPGGLDWGRLVQSSVKLAWTAPVAEAVGIMSRRGWALPELHVSSDHIVDRLYWRDRLAPVSRSKARRLRRAALLEARKACHRKFT